MPDGRIYTFYSYKGGVGRSFALANISVALAQWGYRVLCVDFDLEAPGLGHYFRPWIKDGAAGVVDLIGDLVEERLTYREVDGRREVDWDGFKTPVDITTANYGAAANGEGTSSGLDLLTAGCQDDAYIDRVQGLDWTDLFEKRGLGALLEDLRSQWTRDYDFVFVDSRTGITDIGGICTVQLPDVLVTMFTANDQSLDGVMEVMDRATVARKRLPYDRAALVTLPIVSRLDTREEYARAQQWRGEVAQRLAPYFSKWIVEGTSPEQVLEWITIPYFAIWSFGEKLPILEERSRSPDLVSYYLESLAALIAHHLADCDRLVESRDVYVASARAEGLRGGRFRYHIFLSHTPSDEGTARQLAEVLEADSDKGLRVFLPSRDIPADEAWLPATREGITHSQHFVFLVGAEGFSPRQEAEAGLFIKQAAEEGLERIAIPVLTRGGDIERLPYLLAQLPWEESALWRGLDVVAAEIDTKVRASAVRGATSAHVPSSKDVPDVEKTTLDVEPPDFREMEQPDDA